MGRSNNAICPVSACQAYINTRGSQPGYLFQDIEGKLSLKPRFIAEMKKALATIGLHKEDYTGRIGAATTAASVGMEDSTIQLLGIGGPWNSAAFLAYILGLRGPNWPR